MNAARYAIGFAAGLADSFCGIEARNQILNIAERTRARSDGFDFAADLCLSGRRFRQRFIPRKHLGGRTVPIAIDFNLSDELE